jgi:hypothetical protein
LLIVGLASPAHSADTSAAIVDVRVGFAGQYCVGCWTPVEVELLGGDKEFTGRVELTVPDGDGAASQTVSEPISLAAGKSSRALAYVKFGRLETPLKAVFRADGEIVASRTFSAGASAEFPAALPSSERLVVQIGAPIGIEEVVARQTRDSPDRATLAALDDAGRLPTRWFGYESVDTVVLSAADERAYAAFQREPERLRALEKWVELGGHLILAPGAAAARMLAAGGPLARFAPGTFEQFSVLQKTGALESYSGVTARIDTRPSGGRRGGLEVVRLGELRGMMAVHEGDLPLVVRAPRVFGSVTFVAVDLSQEPLSAWPGRAEVANRLLGAPPRRGRQDEPETARAPATHLGLTDLAGQLRGALDQFPGVELAPFWLVAGLVFVYLLLIGPVDFLLHRQLTRRMGLTWITFPFWVLLFSAGAYWGAGRMKGDKLRVNQVDLVDFDVASRQVRGTSWLNVFSPATTAYDLSLRPELPEVDPAEPVRVLWSWMGMPGPVLGGMEQTAAVGGGALQAYRFSPGLDQTIGVSIPIWSTKPFTARWECQAAPRLESRLKSGVDGVAEGRITSRLAAPLTGSLLVCGRWAFQIGDIAPGETVLIRPGEQRDLQAVLKDFKMVKETKNLVQVSTPYNQAGFEVRSILQQMMFYDAAGGRRYTGLANRYQEFADLSDHLDLGQAILWGATNEQPAELQSGGKPLAGADERHWTFYRFVLPLESNQP